ncbi:33162_t:CDS:1, partial [Racocetra persica]
MLTITQQKQTQHANKKRHHLEFNIGDKVLLSTKNIVSPTDKQRPTKKLLPKYVGPYLITKIISK